MLRIKTQGAGSVYDKSCMQDSKHFFCLRLITRQRNPNFFQRTTFKMWNAEKKLPAAFRRFCDLDHFLLRTGPCLDEHTNHQAASSEDHHCGSIDTSRPSSARQNPCDQAKKCHHTKGKQDRPPHPRLPGRSFRGAKSCAGNLKRLKILNFAFCGMKFLHGTD